ncbi:hypothetical protein DYB28_008052 [Aphanomyces astaci]|uniref:U-box domain-containing protein n=1 Tax=Aphanomyces astaci TaxID=112090 RepID=A0A9X8DSW7_APHAT|nr:hypothetical protein DYB28_008052 [Aphanomyces astaci]
MEDHLHSFVCPITHDVMEDPVVACDGHSYERASISMWFRDNNTSPITNASVHHKHLIPNHTLKKAINEFRERFAPFFDTESSTAALPSGQVLPMLEALPERGTFLYIVVHQPMPVYVAPSFITAQSTLLLVDTIVLGKERLYGEDNVIFVELSGHHEGQYVHECTRDGSPCLQRLEVTETSLAFMVTSPAPLSLWPSHAVPSSTLYKAYPYDVVSIEATIRDLNGRMYGRLEQSKLWACLDRRHFTELDIEFTPELYLLKQETELRSNANRTNLGVPLLALPAYSIVESDAMFMLRADDSPSSSTSIYVRTTASHGRGFVRGWVALPSSLSMHAPPPRLAEGPAGKHIQLVLQQAGAVALVLDEVQESGDVSQRLLTRNLPRRFERQLLNCVQRGRRIHRMALGPRGEWYCSGARPDGSGECCWASGDLPARFHADMQPNSLVSFGGDNEYAMVLGTGGVSSSNVSTKLLQNLTKARRVHMMLLARYGGYVIKDNVGMDLSCLDPAFEVALKTPPRGAGQVCSAAYSEDDYVVVFEHTYVATAGISANIVDALERFYTRHLALRNKRRLLIADYERRWHEIHADY